MKAFHMKCIFTFFPQLGFWAIISDNFYIKHPQIIIGVPMRFGIVSWQDMNIFSYVEFLLLIMTN